MSQGSFNQKNRFLGQNVRLVARSQTHRMTTDGTLSGFQDFLLVIKVRSHIMKATLSGFAKKAFVLFWYGQRKNVNDQLLVHNLNNYQNQRYM